MPTFTQGIRSSFTVLVPSARTSFHVMRSSACRITNGKGRSPSTGGGGPGSAGEPGGPDGHRFALLTRPHERVARAITTQFLSAVWIDARGAGLWAGLTLARGALLGRSGRLFSVEVELSPDSVPVCCKNWTMLGLKSLPHRTSGSSSGCGVRIGMLHRLAALADSAHPQEGTAGAQPETDSLTNQKTAML